MQKRSEKRPLRHPESAYRSVSDDGGLVVLPARSEVKVLNPVGTRIYSLLDGQHTIDQIVAAVVDEFDVEEATARTDVESFVQELENEGLLATQAEEAQGA